jgi:hypothetical protein
MVGTRSGRIRFVHEKVEIASRVKFGGEASLG